MIIGFVQSYPNRYHNDVMAPRATQTPAPKNTLNECFKNVIDKIQIAFTNRVRYDLQYPIGIVCSNQQYIYTFRHMSMHMRLLLLLLLSLLLFLLIVNCFLLLLFLFLLLLLLFLL